MNFIIAHLSTKAPGATMNCEHWKGLLATQRAQFAFGHAFWRSAAN